MHWLHCIFSELVRWSPDSIMQLSSACILTGNIWDGWPPFQFLGYRVLFSYQVTTMKTKDTLHYSKSIIYFRPIDLMLLFSLKKFLQKPVIQYRSDGVIQYLEAGKKKVSLGKSWLCGPFSSALNSNGADDHWYVAQPVSAEPFLNRLSSWSQGWKSRITIDVLGFSITCVLTLSH